LGTFVRNDANSSSVTASSPIPIMSAPAAFSVRRRCSLSVGGATSSDSGARTRSVSRLVMSSVSG
jgi:hypothetical protein